MKNVCLFLSFALLLGGCVTYKNPPPTLNSATMTAVSAIDLGALKSSTPLPPTNTPLPTATPDPCVALNLTPEECANQGMHRYSITEESLAVGCEPRPDSRIVEFEILFDESGLTTGSNHLIRQGPNTFADLEAPVYATDAYIYEFNAGGYVLTIILEGNPCLRLTYTLID